jgi:hypothetical protein
MENTKRNTRRKIKNKGQATHNDRRLKQRKK